MQKWPCTVLLSFPIFNYRILSHLFKKTQIGARLMSIVKKNCNQILNHIMQRGYDMEVRLEKQNP
ncbi:hypothetical protein CFP56_021931 [Quercus suber]|uniref:Uncharacterized protein n=1 Tax=Quercus suber TaxID=58331 RepID=A0AAW0KBT0_QUESU